MRRKINIKTGDRFGKLVVIEDLGMIDKDHKFRCICDCGRETVVTGCHLKDGHTKSCGCLRKTVKENQYKDLKGHRYGRLTVIEYLGDGYWKCRCDCGKECSIYKEYLYCGNTKSCGCLREENRMKTFKRSIHFVDGTCVELIANKKLRKSNTSGCTGVYQRENGKYRASICFKNKTYDLGSFTLIEDAVEARKKKEEELFGGFLREWYDGRKSVQFLEQDVNK